MIFLMLLAFFSRRPESGIEEASSFLMIGMGLGVAAIRLLTLLVED